MIRRLAEEVGALVALALFGGTVMLWADIINILFRGLP